MTWYFNIYDNKLLNITYVNGFLSFRRAIFMTVKSQLKSTSLLIKKNTKLTNILLWIKKSQGTGSGVKDVYVSKWTFFEECSFFDEVIRAKHNTMTNVEEFLDYHVVDDNLDTATETESVRVFRVLQAQVERGKTLAMTQISILKQRVFHVQVGSGKSWWYLFFRK